MVSPRIKNLDLAAQIDEGQLAWYRYVTPITEHYVRQIAQRDYRGKRLAYWGHITRPNTVSMMSALKQAGAEIVVGACNVDHGRCGCAMSSQRASVFTVGRG